MATTYKNKQTGERVQITRHFQESQGAAGESVSCVELDNGQTWSTSAFNHDHEWVISVTPLK